MALRSFSTAFRAHVRRFSASANTSGSGPKLPVGNDPAAFHPVEDAVKDTDRWRVISAVFAIPVVGLFFVNLSKPHDHVEAPPEYPYLRMASRSPRFPWGDDDLIGTSYERHAKHAEDGDHEH